MIPFPSLSEEQLTYLLGRANDGYQADSETTLILVENIRQARQEATALHAMLGKVLEITALASYDDLISEDSDAIARSAAHALLHHTQHLQKG